MVYIKCLLKLGPKRSLWVFYIILHRPWFTPKFQCLLIISSLPSPSRAFNILNDHPLIDLTPAAVAISAILFGSLPTFYWHIPTSTSPSSSRPRPSPSAKNTSPFSSEKTQITLCPSNLVFVFFPSARSMEQILRTARAGCSPPWPKVYLTSLVKF